MFNIYARYHRKTIANKYNFVVFLKFSSIIHIIRRNNNTNIYIIFEKPIKWVIIKLNKGYFFYNFKENNNNNGIKRFGKLCWFLWFKLKKARFYGSKIKINLNCILFSYYELIIWRNRQLFLIRFVMLACLFTEQNYHSDKKIINYFILLFLIKQ